jgi:hypothetical protein
MTIDGLSFNVRENLYNGLLCTRKRFHSQLFWIDALSINQNDVLERNHQVAMMSRIYSQAEKVLVWIAPPSVVGTWIVNFKLFPSENIFDNVEAVLYDPYWSRLWILQEIILATRIKILCGDDLLPWEYLENFLKTIEETPKNDGLLTSPGFATIDRRRRWLNLPQAYKSFENLLRQWGSIEEAQCADPRDRIFGLLGIIGNSDEQSSPFIEADYDKSAEEVYAEIALKLQESLGWQRRPAKLIQVLAAVRRMLELPRL